MGSERKPEIFGEDKETDIRIRPKDVQFEVFFSGSTSRIEVEPEGEFRYFSGEARPIAPKYKLFLPEKYKNKENMSIIFEEMMRRLLSGFAESSAPGTQPEFIAHLLGTRSYCGLFALLRHGLKSKGICIPVDDWEAILKDMDGLEIDVKRFFPTDDLPFDQTSCENYWQYTVFDEASSLQLPIRPPSCSGVNFLLSPMQIRSNEVILKATRMYRQNTYELTDMANSRDANAANEEVRPSQLRERYQCTYGINNDGDTIRSMSYYPEISQESSDLRNL